VNRRIRCGEPLYRIHTALIRSLAPDLVIAQSHCEVCAVTPGDVERSGCEIPSASVLGLSAGSVEGIFDSIREIARALGKEQAGSAVIECERRRFEAVRARTADRERPSVVMLEWRSVVGKSESALLRDTRRAGLGGRPGIPDRRAVRL
jgi:iron complex transport system substrate-binding protein